MPQTLKQKLSNVLCLGGGTDAGKSTAVHLLAQKHNLNIYDYDSRDVIRHQCLAHTMPDIRAALTATDYERWVQPTAQELFERTMRSFQLRFPLVLLDLLAMPQDKPIIAEGFGLTPQLIAPLLSTPRQAIFFIPTEEFKWTSMKQRGKYARRLAWKNGEQAIQNLFERDMTISAAISEQAQDHGLRVHQVDGSLSLEETTYLLAQYFVLLLD